MDIILKMIVLFAITFTATWLVYFFIRWPEVKRREREELATFEREIKKQKDLDIYRW